MSRRLKSWTRLRRALRKHNLEIRPVMREIFSSAEFYDERAMQSQIKSPVQFLVQTAKVLESPLPDPTVAQNALRQNGPDSFRSAECQRLGWRQIMDHDVDPSFPLQLCQLPR